QPVAYFSDRGSVFACQVETGLYRAGPAYEEPDGRARRQSLVRGRQVYFRQLKRGDRKIVLVGKAQKLATGDQHFDPRRGGQDLGEQRRGGYYLLKVIEKDENPLVAQKCLQRIEQRAVSRLFERESLGDGREDQVRVANWRERHKEHAVREI